MRCTLRPLCPDRVFLNILITLGAKTVDLPSFCYQVHNRALQAYLKSGAERVHPEEPRYPLRYFRKFVTLKKGESEGTFRALKEYFEKSTKKPVHCHALKDSWFFSVGKGIIIVDLKRQLVSLDPDGDKVRRAALEPLIKFVAEIHGIKFQLLKDMADTWYLRVVIPKFTKEKFTERFRSA